MLERVIRRYHQRVQGTIVGNRKSKKINKGNDNRMPPRQQFSQEALQKLEDFERRLARLLGTLPSQEIPLSQLPKEYEKTWGCSSNSSTSGTTAMIRPREYRCKKLGFLLEKHCFRTVEVVQKTKSAGNKLQESSENSDTRRYR